MAVITPIMPGPLRREAVAEAFSGISTVESSFSTRGSANAGV